MMASALLAELAARARNGSVCISDIINLAGPRAHAMVLAVVSLPEALPLPVAGMSTFLAIPLILVAGHMAIFGATRGFPASVTRRPLPGRIVTAVAAGGASFLKQLERVSRPRLLVLAHQNRLLALMCLLLALVIALPIPFGNLPPALCVLLIALGMVQRDGLLVAVGIGGALLILGGLALLGHTVTAKVLQAFT